MNRRLVTILLAAFVVAALCSVLVYRLVGMRIDAVKPQPSTRVVAAARDIKIGTVLSAPDLTTIQIMGTVPKICDSGCKKRNRPWSHFVHLRRRTDTG